jgi:membrane protease YdiL (CAAX protease family)
MLHLERALRGPNQWWKYLVIIIGSFLAANTVGCTPLLAVAIVRYIQGYSVLLDPANISGSLHVSTNTALVLMLFPFIIGLVAVSIMLKPLHERSIQETINGRNRIRWGRFFSGFTVWMLLSLIYCATEYFRDPSNFRWQFQPATFFPLVLVSLLLIPLQTTYEELIFRGYLAQGIASGTQSRGLAILIPGILFGMMHYFNPEVAAYGAWVMLPSYIMFGLTFGLIATLDDGIELPMGAHAANNIFAAVFITYKSSVLQTGALLEQKTVYPLRDTISLVGISILFIVIMSRKYHWNFRVLNQPVREQSTDTV